jgi:uncharacterized protein YeaO (DUF488 family)
MTSKNTELDNRNKLYSDELRQLNNNHESAFTDLKRNHQQELTKRDDEIALVNKGYRTQLTNMDVSHSSQLTNLQQAHRD